MSFDKNTPEALPRGLKDSMKADMVFNPYRLFSITPPHSVVSKCASPDSLSDMLSSTALYFCYRKSDIA